MASSSLRQFRDLVSNVFRLVISIQNRQNSQNSQNSGGDESVNSFDEFLDTALQILKDKDQAIHMHTVLENHADHVFSDVMLGRNDMFEPRPASPRAMSPRAMSPRTSQPVQNCQHSKNSQRIIPIATHDSVVYNAPTLIIHHDSKSAPIQTADVIVTKAEEEDNVSKVVTINSVSLLNDTHSADVVADDEEAVEEEEVEEEEVEEEEVEEEEVEEEEVEEEEVEEEEVEEEEVEEEEVEEEEVEEVEEEEVEEEVVDEEVVEEEVVEEEVVEEVVEEADEEEVAAEEVAAEEGENVELVKIGRKKYFVGETSKLVYEAIDDETPGEESLGRYENGKITKV